MDYTRLVCTGHDKDGRWFKVKLETTAVPKHGAISRSLVKAMVDAELLRSGFKSSRDLSIIRY